MKSGFVAKALVLMTVFSGFGLTACTSADQADAAPIFSSAQATGRTESLYPPIQADAADGHVHEYH
jgi:hypothetical protein